MKLLFDENISFRIVKKLESVFPDCSHVKEHHLMQANDLEVRKFAKENGFTIVTRDSDFNDMSVLFGSPPQIIWLQLGNISTQNIADVLISKYNKIISFLNDSENDILILK